MNEEQRKCQVQVQQRKWPKESKFRYQNHDRRQELGWRKNHFSLLNNAAVSDLPCLAFEIKNNRGKTKKLWNR